MPYTIHKNPVGGEWVEGPSSAENINPSDLSDVVGLYARGDAHQTEQAIEAAHAARPAWTAWTAWTAEQRADALDRIGTELLGRADELGDLLSREEGKTRPEGIGEVTRAGRIFKFFAGESLRLNGEIIPPIRKGVDVEVSREPEGVVGIITPWNFPIAIPAWKIAPALAYGNAVIFKPADLGPGSAWALAEIIHRAGQLPAGTFNLVMGPGSQVGNAIVNARQVRAVSFTGSADTGARIGLSCMQRGAKVQLEMGGKNPLVILNDAQLDTGVWCPYCNLDLRALQEALPALQKLGAQLVSVSPQTPKNSRKSARDNKLTFPILSDLGNAVAATFGLRFTLPNYLQALYRDAFRNDLAVVNGEPSWTLPMPARYVIAQDGTIAYAEVSPDYTRRPDPSELLPVLERLQRAAAAA